MDVLIINYKFPPDQGVATFRVAKFAKYLSRFGCNVYVLTRQNNGDTRHTLHDEFQDVMLVDRVEMLSDSIIKATDIRWSLPLLRRTRRIVKTHNIDVVIQSAPQFLPLGVCLPMRKLTGVPYIVDLRDPWQLNVDTPDGGLNERIYRHLHDLLEPRVFHCASAVVLNNQRTRDLYAEMYPEEAAKLHAIPNGFDPDDFSGITPRSAEGFNIVFPGKFRDDMRWFFEPFARLVEMHSDIYFTHFGRFDRQTTRKVNSVVEKLGLAENVFFEGYVEREEVYSATMGADLGLAVGIPNDELCIPTKIFDYMGCDIPILAVDDGTSAMRDVLRDFPNAYLVDRSDREGVYNLLADVYDQRPDELGNQETAGQYTRRNLTQALYSLMCKLVE